jgi:hypothetical protein
LISRGSSPLEGRKWVGLGVSRDYFEENTEKQSSVKVPPVDPKQHRSFRLMTFGFLPFRRQMPMNKPVFRVVGLDQATCDSEYCGTETSTQSNSPEVSEVFGTELSIWPQSEPATVSVRLGDILPALQRSATSRLAWIQDFTEDPVVITKDLYDVLLNFQRLKNAA